MPWVIRYQHANERNIIYVYTDLTRNEEAVCNGELEKIYQRDKRQVYNNS